METAPLLIITNGDVAAGLLRQAVPGAEVLPWRDVLADGPVPMTSTIAELSEIRADFLASKGWGDAPALRQVFEARNRGLEHHEMFDQIALWFEHDLYDQLQLIQILDWFSEHELGERLALVQTQDFIGRRSVEDIAELRVLETPVSAEQIELARISWRAFREPELYDWSALLDEETEALPNLESAVLRQLQELPGAKDGLSRTERAILEAVQSGVSKPVELFSAVQDQEAAPFMGDWSFWDRLDGIASGPEALITGLDDMRFQPDWPDEIRDAYFEREVTLSDLGEEVLAGDSDFTERGTIDRWLGGTHVTAENLWRFDRETAMLIAPETDQVF
jgi:hypothetical protein